MVSSPAMSGIRTCGSCGHPNTGDAMFCSKCGHKLPPVGAAAPEPEPPLPEPAPEPATEPEAEPSKPSPRVAGQAKTMLGMPDRKSVV